MECAERDRMVLSILDPGDRAKIEMTVDEVLEDGPADIPQALYATAAAAAFDSRAESLPDDEKIVAWQVAAALRERVNPPSPPH